jgi:hypothetical protein
MDEEFTLDAEGKEILFSCDTHYIDYFAVISNFPGLQTVLPKTQLDPMFKFHLDLQ